MKTREWWKLTAAWGAFVFIPFNLFAGTMIGREFEAGDALIGVVLGSIILLALTVPAVWYASLTGRTYAESVSAEINHPALRFVLMLLVPLVNCGWFAIQTIAATNIIRPGQSGLSMFLWCAGFATAFVAGPIIWGYAWLHRTGAIALVAMLSGIVFIVIGGEPHSTSWSVTSHERITDVALLVIGTWIFSSTTCVMDVARQLRNPSTAISAILFGTAIADVSLIIIGLLYPTSSALFLGGSEDRRVLNSLSTLFILIALWSTNDSNFYSTDRALKQFGLQSGSSALIVVILTASVGMMVGPRLFDIVGNWLKLMGWIGIPMGVFWLIRLRLIQRS